MGNLLLKSWQNLVVKVIGQQWPDSGAGDTRIFSFDFDSDTLLMSGPFPDWYQKKISFKTDNDSKQSNPGRFQNHPFKLHFAYSYCIVQNNVSANMGQLAPNTRFDSKTRLKFKYSRQILRPGDGYDPILIPIETFESRFRTDSYSIADPWPDCGLILLEQDPHGKGHRCRRVWKTPTDLTQVSFKVFPHSRSWHNLTGSSMGCPQNI